MYTFELRSSHYAALESLLSQQVSQLSLSPQSSKLVALPFKADARLIGRVLCWTISANQTMGAELSKTVGFERCAVCDLEGFPAHVPDERTFLCQKR